MKLEWTQRTCPVCGSDREGRVFVESNIDAAKLNDFAFASRKIPEYMHPRMVECADCGMLYGNPVLSLATISEAYREAAFDSGAESAYAAATYRRLVEKLGLAARVAALDIGAGDGSFLEQLASLGFKRVVGVEPSSAPVAAAKPEIRKWIQHGFFRASDFEVNQFDLITCFQVMEHFWDPAEITRDAFALLKPGGMFLTVVHNRQALSARLLGARSPIFDIEHLQLFSPDTVAKLLQRSGFEGVEVKAFWNRYPLHYWMKLAPIPRVMKEGSIGFSRRMKFGDLPVAIPAGNLVAAGRKPK